MAFDDKGWPVFPTRNGGAVGSALENRMIAKVGGPGAIRTEIQSLPDGEVMLRTRNGMPEFTRKGATTGSTVVCSLEMDSGVVDLISTSPYSPGFAASGIIRNTDYVAAHGVSGEAVGHGKLNYPKLIGPVIADGSEAKAFASSYTGHTGYTERKKVTDRVPPSIFTGRTRLYVQSLYGGTWKDLILSDASYGFGRPMLGINTSALETAGYQPIVIRSGTGLHFDSSTKQHFLIQVGSDVAYVMPLIATACAERYRKLLFSATLSAADQERIETYILSQSFPDAEQTQTLSFTETPSEAMGYSWHFNWSGTACDIVDVQELAVSDSSGTVFGFKSTHYRLQFSVSGGAFSVSRSVVSGPTEWSVPKHINVMAYPNWGGKLVKAGNLPSRILEDDKSASVYCYYAKNTLKILTVNTRKIPPGEKTRESSPEYFGGRSHDYITAYLRETESGESIARNSLGGTSCVFGLDGVTVGGETDSSTKNAYKATWVGRLPFTEAVGHGTDSDSTSGTINSPDEAWGPLVVDIGRPDLDYMFDGLGRIYDMTASWPEKLTDYNYGYVTVTRYFYVGLWEVESLVTTEARSCKTLVIIPYSDAESVYTADERHTSDNGSKSTETSGQDVYGSVYASVIYNGSGGVVTDLGFHDVFRLGYFPLTRGYIPSVSSDVDETDVVSSKNLVSSSGKFTPYTMPGYGDFFTTLGEISQNYMTLSSANGAVVSSQTGVVEGMQTVPGKMSFLGWA